MGNAVRHVVVTLCLAAFASAAIAAEGDPGGRMEGADGTPLPLLGTQVDAEIVDSAALVTVRQVFENRGDQAIEAVYSFPLPDRSAVDDFVLQIGTRTVRSRLVAREEALESYAKAKLEGKTAALATQIRPNLFTQRIGNILPNERIVTEITYSEDLRRTDGRYTWVFPVVAAPRYRPPRRLAADRSAEFLGAGEVPEHRLDLSVRIDAGLPITDLDSESHRIDVHADGGPTARVEIHPYDRLPVKDFLLSWRTATPEPEAALLAHRIGATGTFCLTIQPEDAPETVARMPREIVFVVDGSGSMKGAPIEAAKAVVAGALRTLAPEDSFQILRFSDEASGFAEGSVPATRGNVLRGLAYVDALEGDGGTEILKGLTLALEAPADPNRLRIVLFLTDGLVGNEPEILSSLKDLLGDARVFALGVGSSPNRFLLDRLAELGRGSASYVRQDATDERVSEEVARFVARIESPVLSGLAIDWGGLGVTDVVPNRVPDLFAGQPIRVYGRYVYAGEGVVTIRGRRDGATWEKRVPVTLPDFERTHSVLEKLWAREKIRSLVLDGYAGVLDEAAVEEEVGRLSLEFGLLTKDTAFVAVDERVVTDGSRTRTIVQPAAWPEGVGGSDYLGVLVATKPKSANPSPAPAAATSAGPETREPAESRPTFPPIDSAPDRHLAWLKAWQREDGSWAAGGDLLSDTGATALALLAFTASGKAPDEGLYGKTVREGFRWLEKQQAKDGGFGAADAPARMIDHALATTAWLDFCAATGWKIGWSRARRAVDFLVEHRVEGLGWARDGGEEGSDTLATAFGLLAVLRARGAGIPVRGGPVMDSLAHLEGVTDRMTGRVAMNVGPVARDDGTAIAAALIARTALGAKPGDVAYLRKGAERLLTLPAPVGAHADPLYLFLATSALRRIGGDAFDAWRAPLNEGVRRGMIPERETDEDGNVLLVGPEGARVGRAAAMALFGLSRSVYEPASRPFTLR